jgi:hypothetical protein
VFDGLVSFIDSRVSPGGLALSPRQVLVKFPRNSELPGSFQAISREVSTAIRLSEVFFSKQESTRIPIFAKFFGSVEAGMFRQLRSQGVELGEAAAPGGIFEFVEGEELQTALDASLLTLGAVVRETGYAGAFSYLSEAEEELDPHVVHEAQEVRRRKWEDWISCITYQRILIHLLSFSQGLYVSDISMDKLVIDRRRQFVMSDKVVCEAVRVVDVKHVHDISALPTVWEVAAKLAQALRSLEDVYLWGNRNPKGDILRVTDDVAELIAEVLRTNGTIEQVVMAFIERCIKKLENDDLVQSDASMTNDWIFELHDSLVEKMFHDTPLFHFEY